MDGDIMSKSIILPGKLKDLRKAHSYTQDYVATALGVVRQTYSHYETGKRTPDTETLYKLAGLYDIPVNDLIQLTLSLDRNDYYDAPPPTESGEILNNFLKYLNDSENQKKYQHFTYLEKELLYYFNQLTEVDQKEIIEFTKIKARKQK